MAVLLYLTLYLLAILSILVGLGAVILPLNERTPVTWQYYHFLVRKPVNGFILLLTMILVGFAGFPGQGFPPLALVALGGILSFRVGQEVVFRAVDNPEMATEPETLPLEDSMELAVIECNGITRCYPLDYVIHHHIINDTFGDRMISLTYCAMCRSILPFDVTEIGPLFVGSFKGGNMIVADRETGTFFQQATTRSIIGKRHPVELELYPFQILTWEVIKQMRPMPEVVRVGERDLKPFNLPIPGIWQKIINSDLVPGLSQSNIDQQFAPRTAVIGITDPKIKPEPVYLKKRVLAAGSIYNDQDRFFLLNTGGTINGFHYPDGVDSFEVRITKGELHHQQSDTIWNLQGHYSSGSLNSNLKPLLLSDEYWFSWRKFHPESVLVEIGK